VGSFLIFLLRGATILDFSAFGEIAFLPFFAGIGLLSAGREEFLWDFLLDLG